MAQKVTISQAVGIRNGTRPCPNVQTDLNKIRDLFDAIPTDAGGTRDSIGQWATVRAVLIAEIAAQISIFQASQPGMTVDGAIDPSGTTLKRMNALAAGQLGGGISARVEHNVAPYSEIGQDVRFTAIDTVSMAGRGPLRIISDKWSYVRRLVRVENCSIKWFGVLFNAPGGTPQFGSIPHIYFTPHPSQGHYYDPGYDTFTTWHRLWHDYTQAPGRQIVTAGKDQVLVVPFYTNAQHQQRALGDFLSNWKEAVTAAVTAAIDSIDPMALRDRFEFKEIYSSSFSDGWIPHRQFHTEGSGVQQMTTRVIDLDGQAAHPPSHWRPAKGIIYLDKPPPKMGNPLGNEWYVGGRWSRQIMADDWRGKFTGHAACSSYLLYHGMRL